MINEPRQPFSLRDGLLLTWIAGTGLFFFMRFSITFFNANAEAIRSALDKFFS